MSTLDGKTDVTVLPDETLNGQPVTVLQFSLTTGGPLVMLVDQKTYDIRAIRYPTDLAPNASQATETYDDYREVSGLRIAFHARVEREGMTIDRKVTSVYVNVALPAAAFVRKEP